MDKNNNTSNNITIMTCDELELQRNEYLATNVTCSNRWYNILRKYSFATEGVGLATVAFLGILANLLSIAILTKRTMKTQISALLITLAVFDILFLFCTFPVFSVMSIIEFVTFINECYYDEENNDGSSKFFYTLFNLTIHFQNGSLQLLHTHSNLQYIFKIYNLNECVGSKWLYSMQFLSFTLFLNGINQARLI